MSLLTRIMGVFGAKSAVNTMEGTLNTLWPSNWWQLGYKSTSYGMNGVAEAAIQCNAQGVAVCPIKHRILKPDGTKALVTSSPFSALLERPNHYQTRSDLLLNTIRALLYDGNAYWYLADGTERYKGITVPGAIHLLPSASTMGAWAGDAGDIFYATQVQEWLRDELATPSTVPARKIAHFKLHTPYDLLRGVSPLQAAGAALAANNAISAHQAAFFGNMSRPSGVLSTDTMLTRDQMTMLREAWEAQSQGINSGKVPILGGGIKWFPMSLSAEDSQIIDAYRMTVMDISRAFRVPLPLLNVTEGMTGGTAEAVINNWLAQGLGFLLGHVELVMTRALGLPVDEILDFDTDVLLRLDLKARMEAMNIAVIGGVYSPNEARAKEGLPPAKDGDEPRVQQQVVPLSWWAKQNQRMDDELKLKVEQAAKPPPPAPAPVAPPNAPAPPSPTPAKADVEVIVREILDEIPPPKDGVDGKDGIDGKDGVSPNRRHVGVWNPDGAYIPGDEVAHNGCSWVANSFTPSGEPGESPDWLLAAKQGKTGRGLKGDRGVPGLKGIDGKDGTDAPQIRDVSVIDDTVVIRMTDDTTHFANVVRVKPEDET